MAILQETTINGNLSVAGEYLGRVVKANNVTGEDSSAHELRLGWSSTNPLIKVDETVQTLLTKEVDGQHIYHKNGTAVTSVGYESSYYYFRPMSGLNVYCGSTGYPWYKIITQRLEVTKGKPVFTYVGSDGGGSTVSYATNCFVGAGGTLSRTTNTSSKTVKHDIQPLGVNVEIDAKHLYDVEVVQFKYNEDMLPEEDFRYHQDLPGFIIEDLDKKYPIAIDKDGENIKHWSWNSQYLIPPMLKLIQEQKKEIDELKEKVSNLEAKIN